MQVVGIEAVGRLTGRSGNFGRKQLRFDRTDNATRHPVLEIENIGKLAINAIGPNVRTRFGIDELAANAHAIARFSNAAFEYVAHSQFAGNLPHIDGTTLVSKTRITGDHEQPLQARNCRRDLFDNAADEIVLLGVAGHGSTASEGLSGSGNSALF